MLLRIFIEALNHFLFSLCILSSFECPLSISEKKSRNLQGPVVLRPGIQVIRTVGPNMGPLPGGSHAITRRVDGSLSTARQFMLHQKQQFLQDQALVNRDRNRSIPGSVGDFFDRPGSPGSGD